MKSDSFKTLVWPFVCAVTSSFLSHWLSVSGTSDQADNGVLADFLIITPWILSVFKFGFLGLAILFGLLLLLRILEAFDVIDHVDFLDFF